MKMTVLQGGLDCLPEIIRRIVEVTTPEKLFFLVPEPVEPLGHIVISISWLLNREYLNPGRLPEKFTCDYVAFHRQ